MNGEMMEFDTDNIIVDTETLTLCRLCTEQQGKYHIGPHMQEQIRECFDIVINTFDGLSQIICNKCQIIAGEIFQAKKNFKIKQQALLERRKMLLLKESLGKEDNISSSTPVPNSTPSPQPNTSVGAPPVNICSPPKDNPLNQHSVDQQPTSIAQPTETLRKRQPSKDSMVAVDDQVPSVSSSERAPTPNLSISNISKTITTKLLSKSSPPSTESEVVEIDERVKDENTVKDDKDDFQSDDMSSTKSNKKCIWKFHCVFCERVYTNKSQLRSHRINFHSNLMKLAQALTTPCSIQMEKINLFQKDSTACQLWVQTKQDRKVKYSGSDPFQFITQRAVPKKDVVSVDVDWSDDESVGSLAQLKKKVLSSVTDTDKEDVVRVSTESVTFSISDSDSRGSFENVTEPNTTKEAEVRPAETIPAPKVKTKSKFALDKAEIYRIVQSCWKTAMIKKSLTAPVSRPWLTHEIMSNNSVDVVWMSSKTVKVSRVTTTELDKMNKDPLASLPVYNSSKRKELVNGHLKLRKMPDPVPSNVSAKEPAAKEPVAEVPAPKVSTVKETVAKEPVLNEPAANESQVKKPTARGPITRVALKTATFARELRALNDITKNIDSSVVDSNRPPPAYKIIAPTRLRPTGASPLKVAQLLSDVKNNSNVEPTNTVALQTPSTPTGQNQIVKFPNLTPISKSTFMSGLAASQLPAPVTVLKAEKRAPPAVSAAGDLPLKRFCQIRPRLIETQSVQTVDPPEDTFMSPIIVSTVSLANVEPKDKPNGGRPMIKCKPTSLLMASPEKSTANPEEQTNKVGFLEASSHILNTNLYTTGNEDPPNMTYSLNQNLNCILEPDTALPLLSQNFTLFNDNTSVNMLNSGGGLVEPNPLRGSIFSNLVNLLKFNNVTITLEPITKESMCELVRFILTIREKSLATEEYLSSEFLVEVGAYDSNVLLIGIQDSLSMPVNIYNWSDEFQSELVKSLKKDNFLQTMQNISKYATPNIRNCVQRFINTITSYSFQDSSS